MLSLLRVVVAVVVRVVGYNCKRICIKYNQLLFKRTLLPGFNFFAHFLLPKKKNKKTNNHKQAMTIKVYKNQQQQKTQCKSEFLGDKKVSLCAYAINGLISTHRTRTEAIKQQWAMGMVTGMRMGNGMEKSTTITVSLCFKEAS